MSYVRAQVVPEVTFGIFASIEGLMYKGNFYNVLDTKFRVTYNIILMRTSRLKVGIPDISGTDFKSIQLRVGKSDLYAFSGYNAGIRRSNWVGSPVSIEDPSGFPCEIQFDAPNEMPSYLAPPYGCSNSTIEYLKRTPTSVISFAIASLQK